MTVLTLITAMTISTTIFIIGLIIVICIYNARYQREAKRTRERNILNAGRKKAKRLEKLQSERIYYINLVNNRPRLNNDFYNEIINDLELKIEYQFANISQGGF